MRAFLLLLMVLTYSMFGYSQCVMSTVFSGIDPKCNGDANGTISLTISGGTMPINTQINGGSLSAATSYNGLSAGSYTIQVVDAVGCTNSSVVTLNNPPLLINNPNSNYDCVQLGSIAPNTSGGTLPYTYSISPAVGTTSGVGFSNLPIGTYTIQTQDGNGCSITNLAGVNASNVSYALTHPTCSNDTNGAIQINISGGGTNTYTFNGAGAGGGNPKLFSGLDTGTYVIVAQNSQPCTYSFLLTLKSTKHPSYNSINLESCSYITLNGYTYTSSGTYQQVLVNSVGCDSFLNINANIILLDTSVTNAAGVLTADMPGVNYQWVRFNPFQILTGVTSQSFTPLISGDYGVVVYQGICIDTSNAHSVVVTGIESNAAKQIVCYPNPTHDDVYIDGIHQHALVEVFDALGRKMRVKIERNQSKLHVRFGSLPHGIYWIKVSDEKSTRSIRIVKN